MSYYPISLDERAAHAFWVECCLSEAKPSNQLLLSIYCSRVTPISADDSSLIEALEGIKLGRVPCNEFPHALFDRWDITVHEPETFDYKGDEEPAYAGRFVLRNGRLYNAGFYSKEDDAGIPGWGHPCSDTLLLTPAVGKDGSLMQREILTYRKIDDDGYNKLKMTKSVAKNVGHLLAAFSVITAQFHEGIYNHKSEEQYDFVEATDAAIALGEAMANKPSKLRKAGDIMDLKTAIRAVSTSASGPNL